MEWGGGRIKWEIRVYLYINTLVPKGEIWVDILEMTAMVQLVYLIPT